MRSVCGDGKTGDFVRLIAGSVVVALAAALLGLCGGGIALAASAGGSGTAAAVGAMPGNPVVSIAGLAAPGCGCPGSQACACANEAMPMPSCTACASSPAPAPTCMCMKAATPTPAPTPTCTCMKTTPTPTPTARRVTTPTPRRTPTPVPSATCTGLPAAPPGTRVPQRADPAPVCSRAPVPGGPVRSSEILPVTGADLVPLVAVASLFVVVGAVALIAGRARR